AGLQGAGLRLNAANSAAGVAGQQQQSYLQSLLAALGGQNQIQGQQQAINQQQADTANAANQLGVQRLGIENGTPSQLASLFPVQSQSSGVTTRQDTGGSGALQGLGGALGLAQGLLSPLGGAQGAFGAGAGTFGSSLLGGLAGLFSDRRVKNDHGTVGRAHGV